jgi:FHS family L-fucose permease-like MFS transporter
MKIFKKHTLKVSDDVRTKAAELTLRESIYPLSLVTILFFLWVIAHFYLRLTQMSTIH